MIGTNANIMMNETLSICATIKVKSAESDLKPNTFTFKNSKIKMWITQPHHSEHKKCVCYVYRIMI